MPNEFYAYIRVSYKNFGANWGDYQSKSDLIYMFRAFIWEEVMEDDSD